MDKELKIALAVIAGALVVTLGVTAGAYLVGALCWLGMDPVTPLEEQVKRKRTRLNLEGN